MNHIYRVNKYTYARYCTETDIFFFKLPELDPDPDLVVKFPDPAKRSGSDRIRIRIRNTGFEKYWLLEICLGFFRFCTTPAGSHFFPTLLNLSINMGITSPIAFIRSLRFCAALCFNIVLFCVASFISTVFSLALMALAQRKWSNTTRIWLIYYCCKRCAVSQRSLLQLLTPPLLQRGRYLSCICEEYCRYTYK